MLATQIMSLCTWQNSISTINPVLEAAASNYFDEIFAQNLLSKDCILPSPRLLFDGGF